jgi:hypothetical protein
MKKFVVKGYDATVENVDILGEVRKVGDIVELTDEQALSLVQSGKLEEVKEETVEAGNVAGELKPEAGEAGQVITPSEVKPETAEQEKGDEGTDESNAEVDQTKQGE